MHQTTYTLAEAAQLLRCHADTLRRAVHDGQLRAARLGRGYRLSRPDLQEFWSAQGGGILFEAACASAEEGVDGPAASSFEDAGLAADAAPATPKHSEPDLRQLSLIAP